jgi:putative phosphoribosyl transferase
MRRILIPPDGSSFGECALPPAPAIAHRAGAELELLTVSAPLGHPASAREGMPPHRRRAGVVPGATHLFEEPGTLEQTADLARLWFARYLASGQQKPSQG